MQGTLFLKRSYFQAAKGVLVLYTGILDAQRPERAWEKLPPVFEQRLLLIPVHIESLLHWVLLTVDMVSRVISVMDSLNMLNMATAEVCI